MSGVDALLLAGILVQDGECQSLFQLTTDLEIDYANAWMRLQQLQSRGLVRVVKEHNRLSMSIA